MRVYGLNGAGAAVVSTPVRRPASDSFSVGNEAAPRAAAGAGAPRLIGGIDALLALQGFDDPLERLPPRDFSMSPGPARELAEF